MERCPQKLSSKGLPLRHGPVLGGEIPIRLPALGANHCSICVPDRRRVIPQSIYNDRTGERRATGDGNLPSRFAKCTQCQVGADRIALPFAQCFGEVGREPYDGGRVGRTDARCWRFSELSQFCAWALDDGPTLGGPSDRSNNAAACSSLSQGERSVGPRSTRPRRVAATSGWM